MIIACLLSITIALGFIFWIFGVAELSGVCGALKKVNTGNTEYILDLGASEKIKSFLDSCNLENSKGDYIHKNF